jgi:DNA invertase Pin-like site-specific DNA recombinase
MLPIVTICAPAIYIRVSTDRQLHRSQLADLKSWKESHDGATREYRDKSTGKSMDRVGWNRLWKDVLAGKVDRIVVARLDRLGRTAAGLTKLFEDLQQHSVGFESIRDKIDLSTPSGRLMAHVLASVAAYETEVRSERVRAGIDAARAAGKRWGGRRQGSRNRDTAAKATAVRDLRAAGQPVTSIAKTLGLSRPTIYNLLKST